MAKKRGSMTLEEYHAQIDDDPKYQAMRATRARELSEIAGQRKREQQPLLEELATAGIIVDWVGGCWRYHPLSPAFTLSCLTISPSHTVPHYWSG